MDGSLLPPVIFQGVPPPAELTLANIAHALTLGLPEAHEHLPKIPAIRLVANGPSARNAPRWVPATCAINGALGLFKGLAPDYWLACDPNPIVARFLSDAPFGTAYLVASKCHPSVFHALRRHHVLLWHAPDTDTVDAIAGHVGVFGGVSATLRALNLFRGLCGTKDFDVWGWDACYGSEGEDHAVPQPGHNPDTRYVEVEGATGPVTFPGDRRTWFKTTASWAYETESAVDQLRTADYPVRVRGPGLMGAVLRCKGVEAVAA